MLATIILLAVGALLLLLAGLWLFGERWRLLRPSTRRSLREGGFGLNALHGYVYGRWTNQYVDVLIHRLFPRLKPSGGKWLSDHYHGKVLTHEEAEAIIANQKDIPRRDL